MIITIAIVNLLLVNKAIRFEVYRYNLYQGCDIRILFDALQY